MSGLGLADAASVAPARGLRARVVAPADLRAAPVPSVSAGSDWSVGVGGALSAAVIAGVSVWSDRGVSDISAHSFRSAKSVGGVGAGDGREREGDRPKRTGAFAPSMLTPSTAAMRPRRSGAASVALSSMAVISACVACTSFASRPRVHCLRVRAARTCSATKCRCCTGLSSPIGRGVMSVARSPHVVGHRLPSYATGDDRSATRQRVARAASTEESRQSTVVYQTTAPTRHRRGRGRRLSRTGGARCYLERDSRPVDRLIPRPPSWLPWPSVRYLLCCFSIVWTAMVAITTTPVSPLPRAPPRG